MDLSPEQVVGSQWLFERRKAYLADCPGFGKTRTALHAARGKTLVVCPAAIRDAGVWPTEATLVGFEGLADVISYHSLLTGPPADFDTYDTVIFDEAHHLKNRKVRWLDPARAIAKRTDRVYLLSGTPTPNMAPELWAQLSLIRPDMPAYWPWIEKWFVVEETEHTEYGVFGQLLACKPKCKDKKDCKHWKRFRKSEMEPWIMGRGEDLLDLPEAAGEDKPLWTPMTTKQRRAYLDMKKNLLAEIDGGITLEALSSTARYNHLRRIASALGASPEPGSDPGGRESGKIRLLEPLLDNKDHPTLLLCYYRPTADVLRDTLRRLGKSYRTFSATDTAKDRRRAVTQFQAGDIDVLLGSIEVIKEGITLTAADEVMLFERSWRADTNHQAIRRVVRRGQDKQVGVRQLVTPRSVDQEQWKGLGEKIALTAKVDPAKML